MIHVRDEFRGNAPLHTSDVAKRSMLMTSELINPFCVAAAKPNQTAQTVLQLWLARWIILFGGPRRIFSDQ